MFVVGELSVGHSEPSLFKVFLAKTFSPLGTFLHLPAGTQTRLRFKL